MAGPALTFEVMRAEHGDCLMLLFGEEVVLIDGGPPGTYEATLGPRLQELMGDGGEPLFIRMVMVSHIDDDHIVGLTEMFGEALDRRDNKLGPAQWRAGELWLNAFGALTGAKATDGGSGVKAAAVGALVAHAPGEESKAIAASIKNGVQLHQDAISLGVARNATFGGGLVERGGGAAAVQVVPGLTFTVLSPAKPALEQLRTKWEAWEREHPAPQAQEAANVDRSVYNLSSIVVLARAGAHSLLLTGDARSDEIVAGLEDAKLLPDGDAPLAVDVLKLPHHGSIRNVDEKFFARIRARHYVISANGRDGNPEDETLALLCDSRQGDDEDWTLWLTYGGEDGDGKPGLHERLKAFFAARPDVDVRFAKPGERHTIALG
jgi:hypothetical protein